MKVIASPCGKLVRNLARCSAGVALIEFAIALPMLVLMMLGGLELTNYVFAHMRVNQIAITVADNAGRVRSGIDESNIYEVFAGAELIGQSLDFEENGRIVLSSLEPNGRSGSEAGQMINWQRCYGELAVSSLYGVQGAGRTTAALAAGMGAAGNQITSAAGTAVMFVEVTYRYQPLIFDDFIASQTSFRYEAAFNVRERTNQNITNTQGLTLRSC